MITIHDDATLEATLASPLDITSRELVDRIVSDARASELWELTAIVVVQGEDTAEDFVSVLGYPPSTGPLGGEGEPLLPYWSWLERHGGWTELLITAGDTGFAWFIIMPNSWFDSRIGHR